MIKSEEGFKQALIKAGFDHFTITKTTKPTNLLMTDKQEIEELKAEIVALKERLAKHEEQDKKPKAASRTDTDMVNIIYDAYPRKTKKKDGLRAIAKAIIDVETSGETAQTLLATVKQFHREISRFVKPRDEKWGSVPHPATWFNDQRYKQAPEEWTALFRKGKYVEMEKQRETPDEPEYWREGLKICYPACDPEMFAWETFFHGHKEEVAVLREWYRGGKQGL